MKRIICVMVLLSCFISSTFAQSISLGKRQNSIKKETGFYLGINPLAIPAAFQLKDDVKRFIPVFTGVEYGIAVCGGYYLNSHLAMETRLSLGYVHQVAFVGQFHLGTNYFILDRLNIMNKGLYTGVYFKFWDYYNKLTEIHFFNVVPYLTVGCWHEMKPVILDFRINQTVAIFSWSSLEHTSSGSDWFFSPWPAFVRVLPTITFTVGWRF